MPSASVERILAARKRSSYNCEYTLRKCKTLEKERLHLPMHQAKGKRVFFPSYNSECSFKPRVLGVNINAPAKKLREYISEDVVRSENLRSVFRGQLVHSFRKKRHQPCSLN